MAKKSLATVSSELYSLLEPFTPDERFRIVKAALTLLGDDSSNIKDPKDIPPDGSNNPPANPGSFSDTEQSYFEKKKAKTKQEELAIAARYRELKLNVSSSKREEIKDFFSKARINFDEANFARNIDNARNAGLFNKGGNVKVGYTLSLYGQKYVDALPNRDEAKVLEKPIQKKVRKVKKKAKAT